ncbi:potassium transporter TrkH [Desulfolithobacter dissulfuricans]|uniref:Potassium transporter TrkH n=1 Tax=Desulfolithobacter dissulfuricans TaxID=2795293 RepID=A0A915U2V6_9BACT|nr:potassium transporter TrkG [Desulfolithobacter dissulfuricans]BCO09527.1 potassium transporter TrkH [Desulfolithobacter dissulfuricans]
MRRIRLTIHPLLFPILFFGLTILIGAVLLHSDYSRGTSAISWIDALFTATSATCVTGLAVVDTGTVYSRFGQTVILVLIQVGGLGIMTLTSLAMYLLRQRVSLTDRIAVGQNLLHDPSFHLGRFLISIVLLTLGIEALGAVLLPLASGGGMDSYLAVFHAVSAFCNAGFSLYPDSLMRWQSSLPVNLVFIALIVLGGIGFSVLVETGTWLGARTRQAVTHTRRPVRLTWYTRVVLQTTLFLIVFGWLLVYVADYALYERSLPTATALLVSLFQSVTSRTAGFNTVGIEHMTNVSLLVIIFLMLIGAAPGSCGGGIKVTTFRVMVAFFVAQIRGREQVVVGSIATSRETLNRALVLTLFSVSIICVAVLLLSVTEGGEVPHIQSRGQLLEIVFEVVSAFATTGLSTGLTPTLSLPGKCIIIALMFIGRLGPLLFIAVLQNIQRRESYFRPEGDLLIG